MLKQIFGRQNEGGDLGQALTLGMTFAVGMAVFSFVGFKLDQRLGGGILFTLAGMFLGLAYGAYETWRVIVLLNKRAQNHTRSPSSQETRPDDSSGNPE